MKIPVSIFKDWEQRDIAAFVEFIKDFPVIHRTQDEWFNIYTTFREEHKQCKTK